MNNGLLPLLRILETEFNIHEEILQGFQGKEFLSVLKNVYLQPERTLKQSQTDVKAQWSLNETIDYCIETSLKQDKYCNVITQGYKLTKDRSIVSRLHSVDSDFSSRYLREYPWRIIHQVLGPRKLSELILSYKGFYYNEERFTQLFGERIEVKYQAKFDPGHEVMLNKALYRETFAVKAMEPIQSSKRLLLKKMFNLEFQKKNNHAKLKKRLFLISKVTEDLIKNHKSCRYFPIFDNICKDEPDVKCLLDMAVGVSKVVKFCCTIIDKIFPITFFGSKSNKSVIFEQVSVLLRGTKGMTIDTFNVMMKMRLKDIRWLGDVSSRLSKPDFERRKRLLHQAIYWIFNDFLQKLLGSFFHITHTTSSKKLLFFRHERWVQISKPFFEKYKEIYLNCYDEPYSKIQKKCAIGKLRLIPKKSNDFRVLNVPLRGRTKDEKTEYLEHIHKEIRPTKLIFTKLRLAENSYFKKLTSINEIPLHLTAFKKSLECSDALLPKCYFLKFDVTASYDNLPIQKILEKVSRMIKNNKTYYLKDYNQFDLSTLKNMKWSDLGDLGSLIEGEGGRKNFLNMAKDKTYSLTSEEISQVVDAELFKTLTYVGKNYYLRKNGISQGLHLSSLFCDLVYDDFVQEKFKYLESPKNLVLRIADDFLIVSTDFNLIEKANLELKVGFDDYGIQINKSKTAFHHPCGLSESNCEDVLTFCGYEIDTESLNVTKNFELVQIGPRTKSFYQCINSLIWNYDTRLNYNTLSTQVNSIDTVLKQVKNLAESVAESFCILTKHTRATVDGFQTFFGEIINMTIGKINKSQDPKNRDLEKETTRVITQSFLIQMKQKNAKNSVYIEYLESLILNL